MASIFRRIIQKVWGVERVTEMISNLNTIPERYGKRFGENFISRRPDQRKSTPWLLAPIYEREGLVFRTYSPSKGEILSLHTNKMMRSDRDDSKLYGGGEVSLNSVSEFMRTNELTLVGSSHGWLASFDDRTRDLFLWNPQSGRRIRLPPVPQGRTPSKVIISCSPDDQHCRALMSFGHNRLAFCCPAEEEEEKLVWTPIGQRHQNNYGLLTVRSYDDFVYSAAQKRFFAVLEDHCKVDIVECWDLRDPQSPRLDWKFQYSHISSLEDLSREEEEEVELPDKDWCRQVKYLVSANQKLYLVTRYIMDDDNNQEDSRTIGFDVHRIQGRNLHRMNNSLDGLVMFVGINHSIALHQPSGQFKPNSIYFTHHKGAQDIGIFDYKNANFCSYNLQRFKQIQPPPFWFSCG